jgi:hypothetical protein
MGSVGDSKIQKKYWIADLFVSGLDILSGCQTISKDECLAADWRVIGEHDGAEGFDPQIRFGDQKDRRRDLCYEIDRREDGLIRVERDIEYFEQDPGISLRSNYY